MYRPNPYQYGPPQQRFSQAGQPHNFVKSPPGGAPFRSPMNRPRYESSPRYGGSPYPDTYRSGGMRPQRSPYNSPHLDSSFNSSYNSSYNSDSRRRSGLPDNANSRGKARYSGHWNSFSSPGSDQNPGGCDDIRAYYAADMVMDPWSQLKKAATSSSSPSKSSSSSS